MISARNAAASIAGQLEGLSQHDCGGRWEVVVAVDRLDGFDEAYAGGADEIDFCWRAQLAGFTRGHASHAVMSYRSRPRPWDLAKQACGYGIGEVRLYHEFRTCGMPSLRSRPGAPPWRLLVSRPPGPDLRGAGARTCNAARLCGQLVATARQITRRGQAAVPASAPPRNVEQATPSESTPP